MQQPPFRGRPDLSSIPIKYGPNHILLPPVHGHHPPGPPPGRHPEHRFPPPRHHGHHGHPPPHGPPPGPPPGHRRPEWDAIEESLGLECAARFDYVSDNVLATLSDDIGEIENMFAPGYTQVPFENFAGEIIRIAGLGNVDVDMIMTVAEKTREIGRFRHLSASEIACILLYTVETTTDGKGHSVYLHMNDALAARDIFKRQAFSHLIYGMVSALRKIPYTQYDVLYRGIRTKVDYGKYKEDSIRTWPSFTSATYDIAKVGRFLGDKGTVFIICGTIPGHDIEGLSIFGSSEKEVLIEPCFHFKVVRVIRGGIDVIIVEGIGTKFVLQQKFPATAQLQMKPLMCLSAQQDSAVTSFARALNGDPEGMRSLSRIYSEGIYVAKNEARSQHWLERSGSVSRR